MKGLEAQKANILAAKAVCNILKASLGPKGRARPGGSRWASAVGQRSGGGSWMGGGGG